VKKLREKLAALALKIGTDRKMLEVAQHRWEMNHIKAVANHRAGKKAEAKAERCRKEHHPRAAYRARKEADRCHHRAWKAHLRAEFWVGRVKEVNARIQHLTQTQAEAEALLAKLIREAGAQVDFANNKVTGGTPIQRIRIALHTSMQRSREFYSQVGTWSARYFLTGPPDGYRFDCSSWFISGYWTIGAPDPSGQNFNGGWTGPLGEHGHALDHESEAQTGDACLFGYAPFFHVEMIDEYPLTGGHGSAAVDRGSVGMLPGPRQIRRYALS